MAGSLVSRVRVPPVEPRARSPRALVGAHPRVDCAAPLDVVIHGQATAAGSGAGGERRVGSILTPARPYQNRDTATVRGPGPATCMPPWAMVACGLQQRGFPRAAASDLR